jgi:hypothetical protein
MGPRPGRTRTAVDRIGRGKERQINMLRKPGGDREPNGDGGWIASTNGPRFR